VADGCGPADGRGDRPVLARLAGELLAAPERGHRGVPDQHRRAVPAVLGNLLLAVAGPGPWGGRVLVPGRAGASWVAARGRRGAVRPRRSGPGLGHRRHRSCPSCWPCRGTAERNRIRGNAMKWIEDEMNRAARRDAAACGAGGQAPSVPGVPAAAAGLPPPGRTCMRTPVAVANSRGSRANRAAVTLAAASPA